MTSYIAFIDFEHLDHPVFLKSFAQSLAKHGNRKGIIIHGDSEYTNRLIQTGMMREDARERAILDLNHRLVALFADHGVSSVGLHGFQKELISLTSEGTLKLNHSALESIPATPALLLSSLVHSEEGKKYIPPIQLAEFLYREFDDHELVIFSQDHDSDIFISDDQNSVLKWNELDSSFIKKNLSNEQIDIRIPATLTTGISFGEWPNLKKRTKIS